MPSSRRSWILPAALVALIAFSLRPALTSVGPLLNEITAEFGLSALGASLLTTAPVLCLGGFGALAALCARRWGLERSVAAVLALLTLGLAWRGAFGSAALFAGSIVTGGAIGMGNVLMPAVVKRDFPRHAPIMTGLYTTALCLGATIAAGASVPLRHALGDRAGLALTVWAAPAGLACLMAAIVWWPQLRAGAPVAAARQTRSGPSPAMLRSGLAWQATGFMGLQSMLAYSLFGWLAPILRSRGDDPRTAGLVVSVCVLAQVVASLPAPILAARLRRQSGLNALAALLIVAGFMALLVGPLAWQWVASVVTGLGMGAAFALAIMLVVLRTPDAATAARLSSMAQGIGYIVAAGGPLAVGLAHGWTGDWMGAELLVVIAGGAAGICGWLVGRDRMLPSVQ